MAKTNPALVLGKGERERKLSLQYSVIAGVDEVGRGCLAGPVYAGAVVLNYEAMFALSEAELALLRDSKTLSARQRDKAKIIIDKVAKSQALGEASVTDIEEVGILNATFLAMRRALAKLTPSPDFVLVDGHIKIRELETAQEAVIDGDQYCYAIAAASILAKCARDHFMQEMAKVYPQYGFERHVGYGTQAHLEHLSQYGICALHRRTFAPIRRIVDFSTSL